MLTRYVFFEGKPLTDGDSFRQQINRELLPLWHAMPGNADVRLTFADSRDADAGEILMVLAVDYPDHATLDASLASPHRYLTRDKSAEVLARLFTGRVHHHVMRTATSE